MTKVGKFFRGWYHKSLGEHFAGAVGVSFVFGIAILAGSIYLAGE